jgi:MobA/MobL family
MAIYLLNVKPFSRRKGGRVTRAAAYRAGERIRDERTGQTYNFSFREDVVHKEILLPAQFAGNAAMDWARDRPTLWNCVERTNFRVARLGRDVMVVLPAELTATQRVQLARRFGQELSERYRAGVDLAVHLPRRPSGELNHHAHLLMTPRLVTPEGIGSRTILELSGKELRALGLGSSKNELLLMRERWAQITNEALRDAGLDVRVDHRSHKARGIDREPGLVLPYVISRIERDTGMPTRAGDALRARHRERVEARLKGPAELARVLQKQKEENRQWAIDMARREATLPRKVPYSARTKEELRQMRRELDYSNSARREKTRAYWQKYHRDHADAPNKKAREARLRAKPSPQLQAARKWLKWRERQQEQIQGRVLGQGKRRGREFAPALTAQDSARNWLAVRERHKQAGPSQSAAQRGTHERAFGKSVDDDDEILDRRKKIERNRDYDYGL